ncbi:MAG: MotA/TolQ/ExbB proton channel family protein [Acidobacteriota bacterium]
MRFFQGTLLKYYRDGGFVMHGLLALSLFALYFILDRMWVLYRSSVDTNEFIQKIRDGLLKKKDVQGTIEVCESYRGPVASVLKAGLLKHGAPREEVEKTIENSAIHEMARLERGLGVLATTASIAPLLGFFGTVVGMIQSFDALAQRGLNDPGLVARGISVALITTATGLLVAIPVQIAYNYFTGKIAGFVREMETSANVLIETFDEMERLQA